MKERLILKEIVYFAPSDDTRQDCDATGDSDLSDTTGFTCITWTAHFL